jgi:hypothetical protein
MTKLDKGPLDQFTFTRIANTDTPFPTDPGSHFSGFGTFPSVDAKGEVAFKGFDANSNDQAIFVGDGDTFHFVVDLNTTLPGNPGPIERLFDPVIGNGDVAFVPNVLSGHPGVYVWHEGSLEVIADQHTVLPDGGNLLGVGNEIPSIDERGNIAFVASSTAPDHGGVFKGVNGTLTQVGAGPILGTPGPQISDGRVAFNGDVVFNSGKIHHFVDANTVAPDGGTFNGFGPGPDISGNAIVFHATTTKGAITAYSSRTPTAII